MSPHKFSPKSIEKLLRKDRLGKITGGEFLRKMGLKPGMAFADVGCGPGFFARPAAKIVGKRGGVYAIDTQKEMLRELKKRTRAKNIITLLSGENRIPLRQGAADFALLAFVLHEASSKGRFLKEVKRILKKGATVVVFDWEKKKEDQGPPYGERVPRAMAVELVKKAGFSIKKVSPFSASHYIVTADKG
jgi:ubiquinone/menaquinone biosynthesis C-methylase UbiE